MLGVEKRDIQRLRVLLMSERIIKYLIEPAMPHLFDLYIQNNLGVSFFSFFIFP